MGSAGIDYVVVLFVEEGRGHGDCTNNNGENVRGKVFRSKFGEKGGRMRGMFRGLLVNQANVY